MKNLMLIFSIVLYSCAVKDERISVTLTDRFSCSQECNQYLKNLLPLDNRKFTYTDNQGVLRFDELKQFKAFESLYTRNLEAVLEENKTGFKSLLNMLYFAFYAAESNSAAFMEYLAEDMMTLYLSHRERFLQTLNKHSFLVKANCNRLNAFFGFEAKNTNGARPFLNSNKELLKKHLDENNFLKCIAEFNTVKN